MREKIIDLVDRQVQKSILAQSQCQEEGGPAGKAALSCRVITISRELGSGGRRVAEELANTLHLSLWDRELVERIAEDADVADHLVHHFDEHVVSEIEVLVRHLAGEPRIGGFQYKRHLARTILQIARIGNAIILGRGGNFILPHALNVRIIATRELRIHNLMQFEGLSRRDAEQAIEESDRERAEFTRRLWGRKWDDPLCYDLTLRMDEMTNADAAAVVATAFNRRFAS